MQATRGTAYYMQLERIRYETEEDDCVLTSDGVDGG